MSEGVPIVRLDGELDISRAASLRTQLLRAAGNRDAGLVVDLSDATYMDSAGVNVLFEVAEALKERQLEFAVVVPDGGLVERVVTLVDLSSVARLHRSADAAVTDIRGG